MPIEQTSVPSSLLNTTAPQRAVGVADERPPRAKRQWSSWLQRDHVFVYVLAILGMVVLTPRFLVLGHWAFERFLLTEHVARPNLTTWPYVPSIILPLAGLALLVFSASHRVRLMTLLVASIPLGFVYGFLDVHSVIGFVVLTALAFGVVKLPISRGAAAAVMCLLSLAALLFAGRLGGGPALAAIVSFQATLLPMLWYSVYEEASQRGPLAFRRFFLYLFGRFFGSPVVTYQDLCSEAAQSRVAEVRLQGVRTIYIALIAAMATAFAGWMERTYPIDTLVGLPLLAASYVGYVGAYCRIVVAFNLFIGVVRLFGIPVRDNFNYWLLAHTPNEHWKRWNMFFREWVVTFVFFPIMRAKRWLFVAVMASLLTSGLLHLVPVVIHTGASSATLVAQSAYWILNGLAIYVVLIVPQRWPKVVARLGMRQHQAWVVVGVILTSAFYAALYGIRANAENWESLLGYLSRLITLG